MDRLDEFLRIVEVLRSSYESASTKEEAVVLDVWKVRHHGCWICALNTENGQIVDFDFLRHKEFPAFDVHKFFAYLESVRLGDEELARSFPSDIDERQIRFSEIMSNLLLKAHIGKTLHGNYFRSGRISSKPKN